MLCLAAPNLGLTACLFVYLLQCLMLSAKATYTDLRNFDSRNPEFCLVQTSLNTRRYNIESQASVAPVYDAILCIQHKLHSSVFKCKLQSLDLAT